MNLHPIAFHTVQKLQVYMFFSSEIVNCLRAEPCFLFILWSSKCIFKNMHVIWKEDRKARNVVSGPLGKYWKIDQGGKFKWLWFIWGCFCEGSLGFIKVFCIYMWNSTVHIEIELSSHLQGNYSFKIPQANQSKGGRGLFSPSCLRTELRGNLMSQNIT